MHAWSDSIKHSSIWDKQRLGVHDGRAAPGVVDGDDNKLLLVWFGCTTGTVPNPSGRCWYWYSIHTVTGNDYDVDEYNTARGELPRIAVRATRAAGTSLQ